jgi:hypothetical protein
MLFLGLIQGEYINMLIHGEVVLANKQHLEQYLQNFWYTTQLSSRPFSQTTSCANSKNLINTHAVAE